MNNTLDMNKKNYKYVYYTDKPNYICLDYKINKNMTKNKLIKICILLLIIPGIILSILLAVFKHDYLYAAPQKIKADNILNNINFVSDVNNIIDDDKERELQNTLINFYNTTGIIPSVEFYSFDGFVKEKNVDYIQFGIGEDRFNYLIKEEYKKLFNDENHWLIIYVLNDSDNNTDKFLLSSEIGNNAYYILSKSDTENIINYVKNEYLNNNDIETCLNKKISELSENVMKSNLKTKNSEEYIGYIGFYLILWGLGVIAIYTIFLERINKYSDKKLYLIKSPEDNESIKILECNKCHKQYIRGTTDKCPYCGEKLENTIAHDTVICKNCGSLNYKDDNFCHVCGEKLENSENKIIGYCYNCGAPIREGQEKCQHCNAKIRKY